MLASIAPTVVPAVVFIVAQARRTHPMVPRPLLRSRAMGLKAGIGFDEMTFRVSP